MHTDPSDHVPTTPFGTSGGTADSQPAEHRGPDATAYLIVHADSSDSRTAGGSLSETRLQRLRWLYRGHRSTDRLAPLALTLTNQQGHELLSLPDAAPTLGIALPPGTYHLVATLGETRRGYTVSLPPGVRFDLHLRFATPGSLRQHAASADSDIRPLRSAH